MSQRFSAHFFGSHSIAWSFLRIVFQSQGRAYMNRPSWTSPTHGNDCENTDEMRIGRTENIHHSSDSIRWQVTRIEWVQRKHRRSRRCLNSGNINFDADVYLLACVSKIVFISRLPDLDIIYAFRSHFAQNPNLIKKCAMLKMRTILCDVWRRLILVFFFSVRNVNGKIRMIFEEVWLVRFGSNDSEKSLLRAATWIHEAVFYSSIPCI